MVNGRGDGGSLGLFSFSRNEIFIFGGFELGLGKCSGMQMLRGEGVAGNFYSRVKLGDTGGVGFWRKPLGE